MSDLMLPLWLIAWCLSAIACGWPARVVTTGWVAIIVTFFIGRALGTVS